VRCKKDSMTKPKEEHGKGGVSMTKSDEHEGAEIKEAFKEKSKERFEKTEIAKLHLKC